MRLFQGEPSTVYVKDGDDLHPIGKSFVVDSTFPIGGTGASGVSLELSLPFFEAMELMSRPKLQIVTEINALAEAESFFLGIGIKITEASSKFCGFELTMAPEQKAGFSSCANSLDELVIPDINATIEEADLITMSPELYAYETRRKNLAFGSLMGMSGSLAVALFAYGMHAGGFGCRRSQSREKEARDVKVLQSAAAVEEKAEDQQAAEAADCTNV
jgi:hypothetical protein